MSEPVQVFELKIEVESDDIDELGHVNNVTYVGWVREAAVAHWRSAAPPADLERLAWIVLRHEIDYKRAAMPGDALVARTWVGSATRLKFSRHTEIVRANDGVVLAKALTLWCPLDRATGRPAVVSDEVRRLFAAQV